MDKYDSLRNMSLTYLSTIDKYIGKQNIFTSEELRDCDDLEKTWEESMNEPTFYQLLEIFPEARATIKKTLTAQIKRARTDLIRAEEIRIEYNNKVLSKIKREDRWFHTMIRDIFYIEPLTNNRERLIKRNYFLLSGLKPKAAEVKGNKITDQDIAKAKMFPLEHLYIDKLIKRGSTGVGRCPFHNDRGPSFTIYLKTNRFWCYGCSTGSDPIDYVVKRDNCTFLEAVKKLVNK